MRIGIVKGEIEGQLIKGKAAKFFKVGCDNNSQKSCYELGRYHMQVGDKLIEGMTLRESCKKGYRLSCDELNKLK